MSKQLKTGSQIIRTLAALLFFAIGGLATSAPAAGPGVSDDARCLVVALNVGRSSDPARKAASDTAMMYFLGRLDGSAPTIDLNQTVIGEMGKMSPANLQNEAQRCGQIMQARGHAMGALSKALNELAAQKTSGQQ